MSSWAHGPVGYVLATEEHGVGQLLDHAELADRTGLGFLFVSDHFHPWSPVQGHSSNLWPLLGGMAMRTTRSVLVSAVTCPILRIHPTTLAQAAATVAHMSAGRFILGLGTGEFLNEHITGEPWPPHSERLARLEEATTHLRALLSGREVSIEGRFFSIDRAQLYDPAPDLPIYFAASGEKTAESACALADGLLCLGARQELVEAFNDPKRPRLAQLSVCWAASESDAEITAHRYFPEVAMPGTYFTCLATPREYQEAAREVSRQDVAASIVCGPDQARYIEAISECFEAGFDAVALHQIGPDQTGFLRFWKEKLSAHFS